MNPSKLGRARRHVALRGVIVAVLLLATTSGFPQSPSIVQQRDAFRAAYAAAQNGQDWRTPAAGLSAYPLYPYLEAAALQHDIATADRAQVDAYLQRYAGWIPAGDLRRAELRYLAQQRDWAGFQHFYQPGLGDGLTCDALQANLAAGKPLDFDRDLASLWQQTSLPSDCDPVLSAAAAQGLLTPTRVWNRIERAADAGRSATITQSAAWLAGDDAAAARRIADAISSPAALLKQAPAFSDTTRNRDAIRRALVRYARRSSAQAQASWQALSKQFAFGADSRGRVEAALALYNAVDFGPDAVARLANLPPSAQTDATREWRVRAAVAQGDWRAAQAAIAALTPDEMQHDEWRYWQARIAQKLGQASAALDGYSALAQQATFYGFLAADRANLPYSICPRTVPDDPSVQQQVESDPGLVRAFEFFALDMLPNARREWNRAYPNLTPAQQQQAAALATRRGWADRAVFALTKSGDLDYYALRFPLADRGRVVGAADNAGIAPAWAFAIIRAETAWQTDAHSGANARGLMQLLPATAQRTAKNFGQPYRGTGALTADPAYNAMLGAAHLGELIADFNGSYIMTIAGYNAGPGRVRQWIEAFGDPHAADVDPIDWIERIPFTETRNYVQRVLENLQVYRAALNGGEHPIRLAADLTRGR